MHSSRSGQRSMNTIACARSQTFARLKPRHIGNAGSARAAHYHKERMMSDVIAQLRQLSEASIAHDEALVARLKAERDAAIIENQELRIKVASLEGQVLGYKDAIKANGRLST